MTSAMLVIMTSTVLVIMTSTMLVIMTSSGLCSIVVNNANVHHVDRVTNAIHQTGEIL